MRLRSTHTYALMEVSRDTFNEIRDKLLAVDYRHAIHEPEDENQSVRLDMHGIALVTTQSTSEHEIRIGNLIATLQRIGGMASGDIYTLCVDAIQRENSYRR